MCRLVGSGSHTTSSGHPAIVRGFTACSTGNTRILRRADAGWDGIDPDAIDPTFEEAFAAGRARWARFYTQGTLERGWRRPRTRPGHVCQAG